MAKTDVIRYTLRLNLNNPEHLAVHEALRNLNTDIYKSQNGFMVEAILRYINGGTGAADGPACRDGETAREELAEVERRVTDKVMKEMISFLCSILAGRTAVPTVAYAPGKAQSAEELEENTEQYDETLASLVDQWS